jgi:hypothetical protein
MTAPRAGTSVEARRRHGAARADVECQSVLGQSVTRFRSRLTTLGIAALTSSAFACATHAADNRRLVDELGRAERSASDHQRRIAEPEWRLRELEGQRDAESARRGAPARRRARPARRVTRTEPAAHGGLGGCDGRGLEALRGGRAERWRGRKGASSLLGRAVALELERFPWRADARTEHGAQLVARARAVARPAEPLARSLTDRTTTLALTPDPEDRGPGAGCLGARGHHFVSPNRSSMSS